MNHADKDRRRKTYRSVGLVLEDDNARTASVLKVTKMRCTSRGTIVNVAVEGAGSGLVTEW